MSEHGQSPSGSATWLRNISLRWRFILLIALFTLFVCGVTAMFYSGMRNLADSGVVSAQKIMLQGQRDKLVVASNALASAIGAAVKDLPDKAAKIAMIRSMVDEFRFEEDKSGYYVVYEGTVNVALPIAKDRQGKDLSAAKDKNGVEYVHELARKAQSGGGFV